MFDDDSPRLDPHPDDTLDFSGLEPSQMFVSSLNDERDSAPRWVYWLVLLLTVLLIAAILLTTYLPDVRIIGTPPIQATPTLLPRV